METNKKNNCWHLFESKSLGKYYAIFMCKPTNKIIRSVYGDPFDEEMGDPRVTIVFGSKDSAMDFVKKSNEKIFAELNEIEIDNNESANEEQEDEILGKNN